MKRYLPYIVFTCCILSNIQGYGSPAGTKDTVVTRSDSIHLLRLPSGVTGQSPTFTLNQKMTNYMPVSPSSARLLQEINYPVDYNTGALNLSIPIYEITTRDFVLPIRLKCLTTGIKVSDWGGWTGIGWTLEAEPCITREVRGKEDENGYLRYNDQFGKSSQIHMYEMMKGYHDEKPDIFYYKTLSNNGKFVFKRPESSSETLTYRPLFFPASPEKVTVPVNLTTSLQIQDEAGNTYLYGGATGSTEETRNNGRSAITTWHATSITSPQQDQINFSYIKINTQGVNDYSIDYDFYGVEDKSNSSDDSGDQVFPVPNCGYWKGVSNEMKYYKHDQRQMDGQGGYIFGSFVVYPQINSESYMSGTPVVYPSALSRIDFEGGHLEFTTTNNRLTQIKIYEGTTLLRTVDFTYSLYQYQTSRYKLDKVVMTDKIKQKTQTYSFQYNEPNRLHPVTVKYQDYWGYYNSHTENTDLVPRQTIRVGLHEIGYNDLNAGPEGTLQIGGANREADMSSQMYTIREIIYPSGEIDRFKFELNRYTDPRTQTAKNAGGLRIKEVSTYTESGAILKRRCFDYGTDGTGNIWIPPSLELYEEDHVRLYIYPNHVLQRRYRIFSSQPCISLFYAGGAPVLYTQVTETLVEQNEVKKKTEYRYSNRTNYSLTSTSPIMFVYDYLDDWKYNGLLNEKEYNTSTDKVVNEKAYNYIFTTMPATVPTTTDVGDVYAQSLNYFIPPATDLEGTYILYANRYTLNGNQKYVNNSLVETRTEGTRTIRKEQTNTFGTTEYDVRTGNPIKITETNSDGRTLVQQVTYPYHSTSTAAQRMMAQNDLMKPLEEKYQVNKGGVLQTEKKIIYTYDAAACGHVSYKLSSLKENNTLTGTTQDVETYNRYDAKGNLTEYTRKDGVVVTLLWGYNYQRLVAEIIGAPFTSVISDANYISLQSQSGTTLQSTLQTIRNNSTGLVTTFTWYPTRGIATKTDPMGVTTSYTYDGMNRLVEIKDKDGNVQEQYEYNTRN